MMSGSPRPLPPLLSEVECWLTDLDTACAEDDVSVLDAHERERLGRLRGDLHRQRYQRAHMRLRRVLAEQCGCAPGDVAYAFGAHGKPRLANGSAVQFSLSHSAEIAVIAVSRTRTVGVDIEHLRFMPEATALARRWFHPEEAHAIEAAHEAEQASQFLTCWTRKEAALKALGTGLHRSPASFFVGTALLPLSLQLAQMRLELRSLKLDRPAVLSIAASVDIQSASIA